MGLVVTNQLACVNTENCSNTVNYSNDVYGLCNCQTPFMRLNNLQRIALMEFVRKPPLGWFKYVDMERLIMLIDILGNLHFNNLLSIMLLTFGSLQNCQ